MKKGALLGGLGAALLTAPLLLASAPLRLASGTLDTASSAAAGLSDAVPEGAGPRLHLVQLPGPVQAPWLEALRATGVRVVDYVPENGYLVYGDAEALARVAALAAEGEAVAWHGEYGADLKIDTGVRAALAGAPARTVAVQLVDDPPGNGPTLDLIARSQTAPPLLSIRVLSYLDIVVSLPSEAVAALSRRPDVISIRAWVEPVKLDERQDQIVAGSVSSGSPVAASYLSWLSGQGFSASQFTSFAVDVADSGIDNGSTDPDHPGLRAGGVASGASRVSYMYLVGTPNLNTTGQGCDGHGTISAHILGGYASGSGAPFADASGFHYGLGVCPFVTMGSSIVFDPWGSTHPNYVELVSKAWQNGARLTSNGWGAPGPGTYDIVAQAYDALVRDAQPSNAPFPASGNQEMVVLFAAGNQGPSAGIASPGSAKNVITVGAAEGVQPFGGADQCGVTDTLASSADDVHPASSRGPTADGRAKPDLVAPGTHVSGGVPQASSPAPTGTALACYASNTLATLGVCGGPGSLPAALYWPQTGQQLYTASSGTSMAVPAVAGAAALLRQRFLNQGLPAPSPAMTKAILMNAARYLVGAGANDTLPSPAQGMGEIDLGDALDRIGGTTSTVLRDEVAADLFTATGQTRTFTGSVATTAKPFRVTLAFTDAPGSTAAASAWSNDLDLTVTVGGTTYRGNVFSGASSAPGGSADGKNNVESVFLPAGTSGPFTVTVTAANIAADGVPGNATTPDQDFALVISNGTTSCVVSVTPPAAVTVDQSLCCGTFGGATSATSTPVATFLAGGSATDTCGGTPTRLTPQVSGADVTGTTCFAAGTTTVTFRYQDASGATGTATSTATVRMVGDLNGDGVVDPTDSVVLRAYFNFAATPGTPPFSAPLRMADLNHDTAIDPTDFVVLRGYFNFVVSCLAP